MDVGGGGTDGSLNLVGGGGLKLEVSGTTGPVGLKPEASVPTTGLDDEKGIIDCGFNGGAGLKLEGSVPTTGPDEKGDIV